MAKTPSGLRRGKVAAKTLRLNVFNSSLIRETSIFFMRDIMSRLRRGLQHEAKGKKVSSYISLRLEYRRPVENPTSLTKLQYEFD